MWWFLKKFDKGFYVCVVVEIADIGLRCASSMGRVRRGVDLGVDLGRVRSDYYCCTCWC